MEKGDVIVRTQYDDIEQNEVLWIPQETCHLPDLPGGFALRVDEFLGRGARDVIEHAGRIYRRVL